LSILYCRCSAPTIKMTWVRHYWQCPTHKTAVLQCDSQVCVCFTCQCVIHKTAVLQCDCQVCVFVGNCINVCAKLHTRHWSWRSCISWHIWRFISKSIWTANVLCTRLLISVFALHCRLSKTAHTTLARQRCGRFVFRSAGQGSRMSGCTSESRQSSSQYRMCKSGQSEESTRRKSSASVGTDTSSLRWRAGGQSTCQWNSH